MQPHSHPSQPQSNQSQTNNQSFKQPQPHSSDMLAYPSRLATPTDESYRQSMASMGSMGSMGSMASMTSMTSMGQQVPQQMSRPMAQPQPMPQQLQQLPPQMASQMAPQMAPQMASQLSPQVVYYGSPNIYQPHLMPAGVPAYYGYGGYPPYQDPRIAQGLPHIESLLVNAPGRAGQQQQQQPNAPANTQAAASRPAYYPVGLGIAGMGVPGSIPLPSALPGTIPLPAVANGTGSPMGSPRGRRKRANTEAFARASSIAGTIYNSSAVYKRLKPSTSTSSVISSETGNAGLRPQGRPFSSNITGRFLLHKDVLSLLRYMNKKGAQKLAIYDFTHEADAADDDVQSSSALSSASLLQTPSSLNMAPTPCKFEEIDLDVFETSDPLSSLDAFFGVKHSMVRQLDESRPVQSPITRTITHHPHTRTSLACSLSTTALPAGSSSQLGSPSTSTSVAPSVKSESPRTSTVSAITASTAATSANNSDGKQYTQHNLNFILNKRDNVASTGRSASVAQPAQPAPPAPAPTPAPTASVAPSTPTATPTLPLPASPETPGSVASAPPLCRTSLNFHRYIVDRFGINSYQFIKAIRDSNGHILKLESIRPPHNARGDIEYSAEWVKRAICYPRYKGGMKIHLVRDTESFILYNDLKMMLWDVRQEESEVQQQQQRASAATQPHQPPLLTPDAIAHRPNAASLSPAVRDTLFGGRRVYLLVPT